MPDRWVSVKESRKLDDHGKAGPVPGYAGGIHNARCIYRDDTFIVFEGTDNMGEACMFLVPHEFLVSTRKKYFFNNEDKALDYLMDRSSRFMSENSHVPLKRG